MTLFVDTPQQKNLQVEGSLIDAEAMAETWFNQDENAAKLSETYAPAGYTARIYTIDKDPNGHRRETLTFRVSTVGPKPQLPTLRKEGQQ